MQMKTKGLGLWWLKNPNSIFAINSRFFPGFWLKSSKNNYIWLLTKHSLSAQLIMTLFTFSPEVLKYFYALLKFPCLSPEAAAFQRWSDVRIPSRACNWFLKPNMHSRIFSGGAVNKHPAFLLSNMSSLDHSSAGLTIPQLCYEVLQNGVRARIFISQEGSREVIRDLSYSP